MRSACSPSSAKARTPARSASILYVRDSFERITVLHLVVAEPYAVGGPRAGYNLRLRLVQAVKRVARRTTGIRHVELLYSQERPRAAFA